MTENTIPGVNMDAGLELYGGEMDIFIDVLESFAANTPGVIEKLRHVTLETLPDYAITVHGLKSICASIAAQDISARARNLEMLAKAGDLSGVLAANDELLKDTGILVDNVKSWLDASRELVN